MNLHDEVTQEGPFNRPLFVPAESAAVLPLPSSNFHQPTGSEEGGAGVGVGVGVGDGDGIGDGDGEGVGVGVGDGDGDGIGVGIGVISKVGIGLGLDVGAILKLSPRKLFS